MAYLLSMINDNGIHPNPYVCLTAGHKPPLKIRGLVLYFHAGPMRSENLKLHWIAFRIVETTGKTTRPTGILVTNKCFSKKPVPSSGWHAGWRQVLSCKCIPHVDTLPVSRTMQCFLRELIHFSPYCPGMNNYSSTRKMKGWKNEMALWLEVFNKSLIC